jgi:uncharacterized protein YndB with AHSA1/START domain
MGRADPDVAREHAEPRLWQGACRVRGMPANGVGERRSPRFLEIVPNERIVMDYGTPDPADPDRFRLTVTFDEQADGKTVLTLRQLHPSTERRQTVIGFGAVEYGFQTLDGLVGWMNEKVRNAA